MNRPLNPFLYGSLQQRYGDVLTARAGEEMHGCHIEAGGRKRFSMTRSGEYYRINCPFCPKIGAKDDRHRLWVHHRWGVGPQDGSHERMWWAAICYNNDCMSKTNNQRELRTAIYSAVGRERYQEIEILPGHRPSKLGAVTNPGFCIPVHDLPVNHPACQYLRSRQFDPIVLGQRYGVCFCQSAPPDYPVAANRIIIPIYTGNKQVGWQARLVGDSHRPSTPKYYFMRDFAKSEVLYDFDHAKSQPFVIITEGVTDAWAVGSGAVALFGKTMSETQYDLVTRNWDTAVLLLDADAIDAAADIHHKLSRQMSVVRVTLPDGVDPASADREFLWDLIDGTAKTCGIDLLATSHPSVT